MKFIDKKLGDFTVGETGKYFLMYLILGPIVLSIIGGIVSGLASRNRQVSDNYLGTARQFPPPNVPEAVVGPNGDLVAAPHSRAGY